MIPDDTLPRAQLLTVRSITQCNAIHKSIVEQFRIAVVYGKSVKHQPQRVGLAHELADEDISESRRRRIRRLSGKRGADGWQQ